MKAYRADQIDIYVAYVVAGECLVCVSGAGDSADAVLEIVPWQPEEAIEI
jgi:hypothetical protein